MYLVNTRPTFAVAFAPDGDPADAGTVTVSASNAAGETVPGTVATTGSGATTVYQWTPDTPITAATTLAIEWTRTDTAETLTTVEEIVGSLIFTEAAARAYRVATGEAPLADTARFPDLQIQKWRQAITELFEQRTGRSWIERHARIVAPGNGRHALPLAGTPARTAAGATLNRPGHLMDTRTVLAVTADGSTVDPANVTPWHGALLRSDTVWPAALDSDPLNVTAEFTYGLPHSAEAEQRALELLAANIIQSDVPPNATAVTAADGNTYRLSALPLAVDEFLKSNRFRLGIA